MNQDRNLALAGAATPSSGAISAMQPPREPLWILNGIQDFVLFVGTPLFILPVVLLAERYFAATQMYIVIAAFGALGHHLPGMMRAYGDRALFQRFKARFILGPIFLVGTCAAFAIIDPELHAVTMIAYGWGLWHGMMQTFGFLRIYDAKRKSFAKTTARLDQWMCITWFGAGVFFSQSRVHYILEAFYHAGGPQIPFTYVANLRLFWGILTALMTLAFLVNLIRNQRAGHPASPVKLLLLATTLSFWMYCCLVVENLLVGIIMFEIFHDVQYLSIVWLFNRKRAQSDAAGVGRMTRWIFGRGRALAFLYVGLVMLYGCLYFVEMFLSSFSPVSDRTPIYGAILAASGLLHFYYDGFIWKVKEAPTRQLLGLQGGKEVVQSGVSWLRQSWNGIPGWAAHPLRWSPFAVVVCLFFYTHAHSFMTDNAARMELGRAFPKYDLAQSNLAIALYREGDLEGAIAANRRALALDPKDEVLLDMTTNNLGWAVVELAEQKIQQGDVSEARPLLQEALVLNPDFPNILNNQGAEAEANHQLANAILKYRTAVVMQPEHGHIHTNLAVALASAGDLREALQHARTAQKLLPDNATANALVRRLESMGSSNDLGR